MLPQQSVTRYLLHIVESKRCRLKLFIRYPQVLMLRPKHWTYLPHRESKRLDGFWAKNLATDDQHLGLSHRISGTTPGVCGDGQRAVLFRFHWH